MLTLKSSSYIEKEIKKSRFIGNTKRVESEIEAHLAIEEFSEPKASHNCWAYKIDGITRSSDDGEPSGTAGRPILSAIEGSGLDHVVVIITRYFGGIKLGTGGLVRAYGGTAAACLKQADIIEIQEEIKIEMEFEFAQTGLVYSIIKKFNAFKLDERFLADGISLTISLAASLFDELKTEVREASRNTIRISIPSRFE